MLVGRDRELSALDELLRRAELGDRPVAVITGEPGIGKSRLLDALASRVLVLGGRVAWGRTSEVGLTPAFWPWLQIHSALETSDDPAPVLGSLDEGAVAATRLARFAEVAAFLVRQATAPLALLFDDLHAADPSSLQLLEHVLPLLAGKKILVAIAARDSDATPEVATALGRLARNARRFALARLSRAEVDALVAGRADAERVFALSEGNPLFVEELVASLESEGTTRLPQLSSVRGVIRERVARLPAETGRALVCAAVVGRELSGRVLADMLDVPDAGSLLAPALRLGMIAARAPDRFRFSHALVAEAIADELEPGELARLHLRAAQAIERHAPGEASSLAHHLLAAGHLAAEAAVAAAEEAAAAAMRGLAFEDAAMLLARAEGVLRADDVVRRVRLITARAEALQHAGQHAAANATCEDAFVYARALGDGELFARIAVVRGLEFRFGITDHGLVEVLREALERLPPGDSALRARLLARLAAAMQPAVDTSIPVARAWEAIAMARAHGTERERLDSLYTATAALIDYVRPAELGPLHAEVVELARKAGDRAIIVHTTLRRAFLALEQVDRELYEDEARAFTTLATELGIPRWLRVTPMLAALSALLDGRFEDRAHAYALAEHRSAGDELALMLLRIHTTIAASVMTAPQTVTLSQIEPMFGPRRPPGAAWLAAEHGDLDEARAQLDAIGDEPEGDPNLTAMAACATAAVGDKRRAEVRYRQIVDRTGQIVVATMVGFAIQDLYDRLLLVLAAAAERWDDIDRHAETALAVAVRLASPVWAARVRGDHAAALLRRDRTGDRARARELAATALAEARRLGMPGLAARCDAMLGEAPPAPAPARAPSSAMTVARVGELWLVEGSGERHHLKDSRGMQMLAKLVAEPGRELHALDLVGATEGVDRGDSGPALDATARAQYKERIAELTEARDRAEAWGDAARAERATEELEALTRELSRAFGLGGRARATGAAAERARSNVQRRLAHALQQIRAASPALGDHLELSLTTGMTCRYAPR